MHRNTARITCSLSLMVAVAALAPGCSDVGPEEPRAQTTAVRAAVDSGYTFDSSALRARPAAALPADRLGTSAFDDQQVRHKLLQAPREDFTLTRTQGQRLFYQSAGWSYEKDLGQGRLLLLRRTPAGHASRQDETQLKRRALDRLRRWGIPSAEVYAAWQRRLMKQGQRGYQLQRPALHRHKTFVIRGVNGVRVEGHRAVVTHTLDGTINRVLVKWPPLAAAGHRLSSALPTAEIERRAAVALRAEGETSGKVTLRWRYVPTLQDSGQVALTLKAAARVAPANSEPRVVNVDVDAQ